jgi:hypothetical protein
METFNNYNNVTVDLTGDGDTQVVKTSTFEEAFLGEEDFSDAKGKGRARRKKRKIERITNRQEVKQQRKGGRQEARIGRRATRKSARQSIRGEQQASRQERRGNVRAERQTSRDAKARRKMTNTRSAQERENYAMEQEALRNERYAEPQYSEPQYEEPQYSEPQYDEPQYEEDSDVEVDYNDDSNYPTYEDSEEPTYESDDEIAPEEENYSTEDEMFGEDNSGFSAEVTGKTPAPTEIDAICMKIEWNNELISRLLDAKKRQEKDSNVTPAVNEELGKRFDRVKDLETKLEKFSGMSGNNAMVVKNAKLKARQQRFESVVPPIVTAKLTAKGVAPAKIKEWWKTVGCKKYASKFDGTSDEYGMNNEPVDTSEWGTPAYDYDSPAPEVVELTFGDQAMNFSGVDGSSDKKITTKSIVIGAIVGFTAIYLIRKYNLLK